jgi:hypothetical protein
MKKKGYKHPLGTPRNFMIAMALGLSLGISAVIMDMRSKELPEKLISAYEAHVLEIELKCNQHLVEEYDFFAGRNQAFIEQVERTELAFTPVQREQVRALRMRYILCMRGYYLNSFEDR